MSKKVYIRERLWVDEDCEAVSEFYDGNYYVHVIIKNTKPSTIKKVKEGWASILSWAKDEDLEYIYTYTRNMKFLKFFPKGVHIGTTDVVPETGEKYEVIEWELKQLSPA
jgi:hypothetical protein